MCTQGAIRTSASAGRQHNQWYLLDHVSDGQQLLRGVSCLRQRGIVIIASHHRAEPGVVIGACEETNRAAS